MGVGLDPMTVASWRVVYEPDAQEPWLVQAGLSAHWLDWRRFGEEGDARRLAAYLRTEAENGRARAPRE